MTYLKKIKNKKELQVILVEQIIGYLFEDGFGNKAKRLVLDYDGKLGGSGWNKLTVINLLNDIFRKYIKDE